MTHSSGQSVAITYNAANLIEAVTDHIGRETRFTYDAANEHLVSASDYDVSVTNYTYVLGSGDSSEHALAEIEFPGGTHQFYSYDPLGRIIGMQRDERAGAVTFSYDTAGLLIATNGLGDASNLYFDHRGLPVRTVNPLGDSTTFKYDGEFQPTESIDGGTTQYDSQPDRLRDIQAVWTLNLKQAQRIEILEDATRTAYLKKGETVHDDKDRDHLFDLLGRNWFFYDPPQDRAFGRGRR